MRAGGIESLDYAIVLPTVEICVERVATRTGHAFTDEAAARHMHAQFAQADLDPRHVAESTASVDAVSVSDRIVERRVDNSLNVSI